MAGIFQTQDLDIQNTIGNEQDEAEWQSPGSPYMELFVRQAIVLSLLKFFPYLLQFSTNIFQFEKQKFGSTATCHYPFCTITQEKDSTRTIQNGNMALNLRVSSRLSGIIVMRGYSITQMLFNNSHKLINLATLKIKDISC